MLEHRSEPLPDRSAMPVALSLNAIAFLNQIPRAEAQRIERALERLAADYNLLAQSHVRRLAGMNDKDGHQLSTFRVAHGVRAFIYVEQGAINVVDIIRRSQLDSLKTLPGSSV